MRFKQYLYEEEEKYTYPHASPTSKEEAIAWIKQHSQAHIAGLLRGGPAIWRGFSFGREDHQYGFGDTSKFVRKAANTFNFINLLVSNSPKWADYPKRESAYICTTDLDNAANFGEVYLVIPADNAQIGIVPTFDFWYGFKEFDEMFKSSGVEMMNEVLNVICKRLDMPINNNTDYNELKNILSNIDRADLEEIVGLHPDTGNGYSGIYHKYEVESHKDYSVRIKAVADQMDYRDTLFSLMEKFLDPNKSGFTHTKGETFYVKGGHEVWIGGQCVFISINEFVDDTNWGAADEKIKEWLDAI